jgi:hypothetical protein
MGDSEPNDQSDPPVIKFTNSRLEGFSVVTAKLTVDRNVVAYGLVHIQRLDKIMETL